MTMIIYPIKTLSWAYVGYLPNKQHEIKMHDIVIYAGHPKHVTDEVF